jgi:hypothetical protein
MTVDALKASKLGKIIVKLVKEPPAPGEPRLCAVPSSLHPIKIYVHFASASKACSSVVLQT